jgi:hypothetical protein
MQLIEIRNSKIEIQKSGFPCQAESRHVIGPPRSVSVPHEHELFAPSMRAKRAKPFEFLISIFEFSVTDPQPREAQAA